MSAVMQYPMTKDVGREFDSSYRPYGDKRKWHKDEDNDSWVEPPRRRRRTKIELPERKSQPRMFGGRGGHMTASLLQQMKFYDSLITAAYTWLHSASSKQEADAANQRVKSLQYNRKSYMGRIKERLTERGYNGPYPVPN